jgi:ATP-dependent DNA helicase RecG
LRLEELDIPVSSLKGAGPGTAAKLARLGVATIADLLSFFPRAYDDRRADLGFSASADSGLRANAAAVVIRHDWFLAGGKSTLKVVVADGGSEEAILVCFNRPFLERSLPEGRRIRVRGHFERRFGELQCASFEVDAPDAPARVVPIYRLTEGLGNRGVERLVEQALERYCRALDDPAPPEFRAARGFMGHGDAIRALHFPSSPEEAESARRAFAYGELFVPQAACALRRAARSSAKVARKSHGSKLAGALRASLPFALTPGQERAILSIVAAMREPYPAARLVQGDVGSGKTLVALFAALEAIEAGRQVAFMAPTELLARQHADRAAALLEPLGVKLAFLTGNVRDKARAPLLSALASGEIDLAVGTHALFSDDVRYRDLGLAIIDEQHRFGVEQRVALGAKGERPDLVMMTATPIPRTLAHAAFGDLETDSIEDLPPGRQPVATHLARMGNEGRVYDFVRARLAEGRQAYFVYPAIDSGTGLKDASGMKEKLSSEAFPGYEVGLLHARMKEADRTRAMASFQAGTTRVLVATSVVEVGVDVPNATCMVIEHAERFGLSALHQLRGRVGRGAERSYCFLVYDPDLSDDAKERLKTLHETSDGFAIAEKDFALRGPGDLSGTAQSGLPPFKCADLAKDGDLVEYARLDASAVVARDPSLSAPESAVLAASLAGTQAKGL